jgi:phosphoenolpyruvate carboxykinase (ATP)
MNTDKPRRAFGLEQIGFSMAGQIFWDPSTPVLYEQIALRHEGVIVHDGPIAVRTGHHTGRSPSDKFIVDEPPSRDEIWWGPINHPMSVEKFERLHQRQLAYLQNKDVFVQNCYAGADPEYRLPIRVVTEKAWQSLCARNLFIPELDPTKQMQHQPSFTVICTPEFHAEPGVDGTASDVFIVINISRGLVLIGGTSYAGEIKKSIFTLMHYLLPKKNVLSLHCSANYGNDRDDVALFFGLSGTGKTALATSPTRTLIGDDEHGWSTRGIFNFEGGCYAKVLNVLEETEPEIFKTTREFGTVLENVGFDLQTRRLDLSDSSLTPNTRAAYPISRIAKADLAGVAGHPRNIIFLTYDAFGILPPVSRMTTEQANYHFLSGYTSKVAGTETGVGQPEAVFSPCFGAPFLSVPPQVSAELLKVRMKEHKVDCWLINTGINGGAYGIGKRIPLAVSRAIVTAIEDGSLAKAKTRKESFFELEVPVECQGVSPEILDPRSSWKDPLVYDLKARELRRLFDENFKKMTAQYELSTPREHVTKGAAR